MRSVGRWMGYAPGQPYPPPDLCLAFTTYGSVAVAGFTRSPFQHSGKRMIMPMPLAVSEHEVGGLSWAFFCPLMSQCHSTSPKSPGRSPVTILKPLGNGLTLAHCLALKGFKHW